MPREEGTQLVETAAGHIDSILAIANDAGAGEPCNFRAITHPG